MSKCIIYLFFSIINMIYFTHETASKLIHFFPLWKPSNAWEAGAWLTSTCVIASALETGWVGVFLRVIIPKHLHNSVRVKKKLSNAYRAHGSTILLSRIVCRVTVRHFSCSLVCPPPRRKWSVPAAFRS